MSIQSTGPTTARVALVGEYPFEQDLIRMQPLVGGGGWELTKMLEEIRMNREQCYITLVTKERPQGAVEALVAMKKKHITSEHVFYRGKMVTPQIRDGVEQLKQELELLKPNVVCAIGNLALWALTGEWGVREWRSSIMESTLIPGLKVIPTFNPSILHGQWKLRPLMLHDLKRVQRESARAGIVRTPYNILVRPSFDEAITALDDLQILADAALAQGTRLKLGADIETRAGHIACIAFAWSDTDALCIPLMCQHDVMGYWSADEEATLVYRMCKLLRGVKVIGQNWNYDAQYIYRYWHFLCPDVEDTMIQQHSCFSNLEKNLSFLSSMYLEDHLHWKDDRTNWTVGPKGEGEDTFWIYNATDALRTYSIHTVLTQVVASLGMQEVNNFQQGLRPVVLRTMLKGVRMDTAARDGFDIRLSEEIAAREQWMEAVLGEVVNIKSPKQMQELFYETLGQKKVLIRNGEGGMSVTTNDEALHKIAEREPILRPLTRKIAELRSLGVFRSTFVQAQLDVDGRIRTSFNICGTETYRFASSKNVFGSGLNCQNIPKGGEVEDGGLELPNVRTLFIPDEGMTMFDIDLDSADLRIVTWESDCVWMKEHFANGRKPYVEVMREYYRDQSMTKQSHPREYAMFKSLCHGTNYLGTAEGIAPRVGLLVHETERIQKWYFGLAPEIRAWQERIKKQVTQRKFVQNAFGYRMHFFDKIEGTIFNQAVAWIPQSTVGCLINRAYVAIDKELPEVDVLLQVHDSLMGQFPTLRAEYYMKQIVEKSQIVIPYAEPLVIPVGIVRSEASWGECG